MPERSSKRKARRDSLTSSIGEPEFSTLRTENISSISDRDFAEISEKIVKSIGRRVKDTEAGQREIQKNDQKPVLEDRLSARTNVKCNRLRCE